MDLEKTIIKLIKQNDFESFKKVVETYNLSLYSRIDIGAYSSRRFGTFLIEKDAPLEFYKFVYDRTSKTIRETGEDIIPAISRGKLDYVKFFYENGENLKVYDEYSDSILHHAVRSGNEELVKFILELKIVDVNEKDWKGKTPLDIAIRMGLESIANLIRSYGGIETIKKEEIYSKEDEEEEDIEEILSELAENSKEDKKLLYEFEKLLSEHIDEVEYLEDLSHYWTIDIILNLIKEKNYEFNEIYGIIRHATKELIDINRSYKEIIPILKNHKEFLISLRNDEGETLLHKAVRKKDYYLVKIFVNLGFDINEENYEGKTPLAIAIENDEHLIEEFLRSRGAIL
ncbi:MAG: ankyrin repeat domain-containing protein [Candidatus Hydrothermia bacterium]|jgi:ankyrin repeat protein|nr:ankyrin repeat domain-containing protein [Candidatus Hydrothermia bacterium]